MRASIRAVSPVIGVILLTVITILLASVIASGILSLGMGLNDKEDQFDESLDKTAVSTLTGNPWSGSQDELVQLSDTQAGAVDVSVRTNFTIQDGSDTIGNSLNSVYLEVTSSPAPDMFSNTSRSDLVKVVVDENSDGTVDQEITHDVDGWQVENGGSALKIGFSGAAYTPNANDSIIVVFEGVENPDTAGTYDLRAETSGDGNWHHGTITITDDS